MIIKKNIVIKGAANKNLLIDIFIPQSSHNCPIVLYAHGFCGFKDWGNFDLIANRFADEGFVFVKFNFSHNGTSPDSPEHFVDLEAFGNNNYTKELEDLKTVTNWLCDNGNAYLKDNTKDNLYLIGHSMGGGMSILHSAQDSRIKKLVTWASIAECKTPWGKWDAKRLEEWKVTGIQYFTNGRTKQELPLYYQLYQDYTNNKKEFDILHKISTLTIPVLICQGTKDMAVSLDDALLLHNNLPGSLLFTLETDHVFGRSHPWDSNQLPEATEKVINKTMKFFKG